MNVAWLANTTDGYMVGDYIATSFSGRKGISRLCDGKRSE